MGEVVVANGAWSALLARRLGRPLPVLGAKGYHVDLAPAAATDPTIPVYLQEARVIATPFADRMRLAGTLQLTGLDTRSTRCAWTRRCGRVSARCEACQGSV